MSLFPDDGLRVAPDPGEPELTAGERLRRRQAGRIANGYHPLSSGGPLRLLPGAPRPLSREDAAGLGDYPSCGGCRFRVSMGGHARPFPKCVWGDGSPRATHSEASDVRAWWPACETWEAKEER